MVIPMGKTVITGGPGVGKTTMLEVLAERGFDTIPEAAREIIEEQQAIDGYMLPWKDGQAFGKEVIKRQLAYESVPGDAYCDRGLVDNVAYAKVSGNPVSDDYLDLCKGRYDQVLLLDPLPNYKQDNARTESKEKALQIHQAIEQAYIDLGYVVQKVPVLPIEERADYIAKLSPLRKAA